MRKCLLKDRPINILHTHTHTHFKIKAFIESYLSNIKNILLSLILQHAEHVSLCDLCCVTFAVFFVTFHVCFWETFTSVSNRCHVGGVIANKMQVWMFISCHSVHMPTCSDLLPR